MILRTATILLTFGFLVSCSTARPNEYKNLALNPDTISNPTLSAMYYGSDSTTDGVLSLEIKIADDVCYSLNSRSRISITFSIRNLSNEPVTIPVFVHNDIGLRPILTSQTSYIYYDPETPRDYAPPTLINLITLSRNESYESNYEYRPSKFVWIYYSPSDIQVSTPSIGKYLLKFIFENYVDHSVHTWMGRIVSNQIEICISE